MSKPSLRAQSHSCVPRAGQLRGQGGGSVQGRGLQAARQRVRHQQAPRHDARLGQGALLLVLQPAAQSAITVLNSCACSRKCLLGRRHSTTPAASVIHWLYHCNRTMSTMTALARSCRCAWSAARTVASPTLTATLASSPSSPTGAHLSLTIELCCRHSICQHAACGAVQRVREVLCSRARPVLCWWCAAPSCKYAPSFLRCPHIGPGFDVTTASISPHVACPSAGTPTCWAP